MKIQMSDLREGPVTLEVNARPQDLDLSDPEFEFSAPVTGEVVFHETGGKVLAHGQLSTEVRGKCVRCLEPASALVKAHVEVMYEHNPDLLKPTLEFSEGNDDIASYFDGESIDPKPELREALLLELPGLPVCSPECKGLCPECGANLNLPDACNCEQKNDDSGEWKEQLRKLKEKG